MRRRSAIAVASIPAMMLASVGPTWACPTCFASAGANVLRTYLLSTIWLSLLPFALIGGVVLLAVRMRREIEAAELDERSSEELPSGPALATPPR